MTVSTVSSVAEFQTNGVTTNFPFFFKFLANSDLVVTYVDPQGVSSTLILGTNYTVNGAGSDAGGSIATNSALMGPGQLIVSREMDPFQLASLRNQGKFLAETHEDVFDKLTMLVQQGFALMDRALLRPFGKTYYDAQNRNISNLKDPAAPKDAATMGWVNTYFGSLIDSVSGAINTTNGIIYDTGTLFDYLRFGLFRSVDTVADLRLLTPTRNQRAFVLGVLARGDGGQGAFVWSSGNYTAKVAADPKSGIYVTSSSDPTGVSGAWVRIRDPYRPLPEWWGGSAAPVNINSTTVSLLKNRAGANQDQWILLFGDSHGWGQGGPEYERYESANNYSSWSANIHSQGFMRRLSDDICGRRGFDPRTYGTWAANFPPRIGTEFFGADSIERALKDPNRMLPIIPICGIIDGIQAPVTETSYRTETRWYAPAARGETYAGDFREKLAIGLFSSSLLTLNTEGGAQFNQSGKRAFVELEINPAYNGAGAGWTAYRNAGGGLVAEKNDTSQAVYLSTIRTIFPNWIVAGQPVFIPGLGKVLVAGVSAVTGGSLIHITDMAGAELGGGNSVRTIGSGMRLFHPAYIDRALFRVPLQGTSRVFYVAVRHKVGGGIIDLYYTDNLGVGGGNDPYLNGGIPSLKANPWEWGGNQPSIFRALPDGVLESAGGNVQILADRVRINTSPLTVGTAEEVVYRIDLASTQSGDLFIEKVPGGPVDIRGIVCDNNKVANLSMGAHTVGRWLGLTGGPDRVAQILNHVPVQPSHIIAQIPFVNEYLQQTPIADFKANLLTFVNRFRNHIPTSINYNAKGVDFTFFTSLRGRAVAFEGAAESPITYSMYVQASKEFCLANNCAFIDAESALFAEARSGKITYQRLYNDAIHPSDYANELIYQELKKSLAAIV